MDHCWNAEPIWWLCLIIWPNSGATIWQQIVPVYTLLLSPQGLSMNRFVWCVYITYRVGQKYGAVFLYANNFVKYWPVFKILSLLECGKNVVTLSPKISPHLICVTTQPCKMSRHIIEAGYINSDWAWHVALKQPGRKSGRLWCLGGSSTDGLSTSTIHDNQPAEASDRHWVGQIVAAFGWAHDWSVALPVGCVV